MKKLKTNANKKNNSHNFNKATSYSLKENDPK